jgi:hypothetical protein
MFDRLLPLDREPNVIETLKVNFPLDREPNVIETLKVN